MSEAADEPAVVPARATTVLFGHRDAELALLDAYRTGRLPHAWLITGSPGIGKATLAYRMARFVLAHPDPHAPAVRSATSLAIEPDYPIARRIAAQAQPASCARTSRSMMCGAPSRSSARRRARADGGSPSSTVSTS
jgi:DNA polymerase-3 subunit delta'